MAVLIYCIYSVFSNDSIGFTPALCGVIQKANQILDATVMLGYHDMLGSYPANKKIWIWD